MLIIGSALLVIALLVSGVVIRKYNIQKVIDSSVVDANSPSFNQSKLIKYEFLSDRLKANIDKKTFDSINSWDKAEKLFNGIETSNVINFIILIQPLHYILKIVNL